MKEKEFTYEQIQDDQNRIMEWVDEKEYEFHPLSECFPLLIGPEFEEFSSDIAVNGQRETVKLYQGKILDGRNRYLSCKKHKMPCRYELVEEIVDPTDYVISMNVHRRHLMPEARKSLVIELRKSGKSIRQIAKALNTSSSSVYRDLENATVPDGTLDLPEFVKGQDGKGRKARKPKNPPRHRQRTEK